MSSIAEDAPQGSFKPTSLAKIGKIRDKSVSDAPYTVIKYNGANGDVMMMGWHDRADLEYYLLNYNVDKNSSTGTNAQTLMNVISTGNISALSYDFNMKRDGVLPTISKAISIFFSAAVFICIVLLFLSLIAVVVLVLLKLDDFSKPFRRYIYAVIFAVLMLCIIVYFFNTSFLRILLTQETL